MTFNVKNAHITPTQEAAPLNFMPKYEEKITHEVTEASPKFHIRTT